MSSIKLGLIGDEPGSTSFLGAYLNSPVGSGAEVEVKKSIVVDGEPQVLHISSCQWQADAWLEITNPVIKFSDGFMFICRPSGNAMKLRTIRKIIYSVLKVRGKIPMVVVSNELTSDASSSFDDNLIHLQTLFSALRCPILRTTPTKNDRMLAIMFADITKLVRKHDYSTDPKGTYMTEFESTLIRETDTHDDFFGASPVPLVQEQIVPKWGGSVLFPSPSSPHISTTNQQAPHLSHQMSAPNISASSYSTPSPSPHTSTANIPPHLIHQLSAPNVMATAAHSPPNTLHHPPSYIQPKLERASSISSMTPGPNSPVPVHTRVSPEVPKRIDSPRRIEVPTRNSEVETRRSETQHRLEAPEQGRSSPRVSDFHPDVKPDVLHERKTPDTISHLHEKMAATLAKPDKAEKPTEKPERLLHYSDIPALRNPELANALQFRLADDKGGEDGSSPWDDSFNGSIRGTQKTRRETESKGSTIFNRNPRPRKFPPVSPPHTPSPPGTQPIDQALTEDVFEDMLPADVKLQRAHLQQQIIARKAFLDKEAELEEVICKIVVIGAPKSGKTGFIENIAQTGSNYAVYRDGPEDGVVVHFDKHLQKNWKCYIMEPARERKVAFQLSMTNADAFVVVYNICSRQSFELLSTFFQEIIETKGDLKGPIMLIGTKLDDVHNREVAREEGQKTAQLQGSSIIFHEISSKTHQNVHTCFPSLLNSFLLRKFKPMSPKATNSMPMPIFVKTNSFSKTPPQPSTPTTPTVSPPMPFGPPHSSSLSDSSELKPPSDGSTTNRPPVGEGKSSGKMLQNLCQSMREVNSGVKRKKKQFFTGSDAIEWLVHKTQASPQDAEIWCQKLMAGGYIRPIIMVDVSDVSISIDATRSKFMGADELYLFDGDTSASNKVLNDRRTSFSGKQPIQVTEFALDVPFHSLHTFLRVKDHYYEVNYRDWEQSPSFDKFSLLASELQRVDFSELRGEKARLAFWINVHNIIAIHSCATFGPPYKEKKRKNFFDALYQVGDASVVSIQDIAHGILRNNTKIPGASKRQFPDDDPRISLVLPLDPRIHFALWHGTKSSAFLGIYGEDSVHVLLQYATFKYLDREVEMSYQKNYIVLPKIFSIFANDFGKDINEILLWISGFFNTEKAKLLKCIMHQDPDIRYKEYEWVSTPPELLFI